MDTSSKTEDRQIVITRVFAAPRSLVWDAWTDPERIGSWWGPSGFTSTTEKMEFRPGGVWRFVMHGPDGRDYQNKITYREIVAPERLVYAHGGDDEGLEPVQFEVTVTFTERNGETEVVMRSTFPTAEQRDFVVREYGAIEGGHQTMARLAEYLGDPDARDGDFVMTRVFAAPRELVWKAWSEADRLTQWWGPKGCLIRVTKLEFRPGGFFHYAMDTPDRPTLWGRFLYREIAASRRLVWLLSFSNEGCGITRAPFSASWPLELTNIITLADHDGGTRLMLHGRPHGATEDEQQFFTGFFASLEQGFGGTFDQLAAYLAGAMSSAGAG
jgi:uncharacterized protein YndB with AHSA1/START domain